nr:MAG: hypothetical protein EDM05_32140 [Leptolyngbya sp. IPPAS B-1204]
MNEQLEQLVREAQQAPPHSPDRQQGIIQLARQILKARQVARPFRGQLTGIYQEIVEQAQAQLQQMLEHRIDSYDYHRDPVRQWAEHLRQEVFQIILSRSCLQHLALAVQQQQPKTDRYQYAICELIQAIKLSGKLARTQLAPEIYQEAVNHTLLWVCQNIYAYNPSRGEFMVWVNYRLDKIGQATQQAQQDPYTQAIRAKIIKTKYQLSALMRQLKPSDLLDWLGLYLRKWIPSLNFPIVVSLITLLSLTALVQQSPKKDALLFEVAQELLNLPPPLVYSEELSLVNISKEEELSLVDALRQYVEEDPDQLFQNHIKGHPEVTLQTILLARLDDETWQSLSQRTGVKIATLSNFFQRSLTSLAPQIRAAIQQ